MKTSRIVLAAAIAVVGFASCEQQTEELEGGQVLVTDLEKISYLMGGDFVKNTRDIGFDSLVIPALLQGIEDEIAGTGSKIGEEEGREIVSRFITEQREKEFELKISKGNEFLAENSKKEGIITLPSGLQYEVLNEGDGPVPSAEDIVETDYHGTLIDGRVFDSSVERGEPAVFPVGGVIPAWIEALQLMKTGSKWKLYCPYELGYGANGSGGQGGIEPYEVLIFEVELRRILSPDDLAKLRAEMSQQPR